jgi:hypothetical protein
VLRSIEDRTDNVAHDTCELIDVFWFVVLVEEDDNNNEDAATDAETKDGDEIAAVSIIISSSSPPSSSTSSTSSTCGQCPKLSLELLTFEANTLAAGEELELRRLDLHIINIVSFYFNDDDGMRTVWLLSLLLSSIILLEL